MLMGTSLILVLTCLLLVCWREGNKIVSSILSWSVLLAGSQALAWVGLRTCGDLEIPFLFLRESWGGNNPEMGLLFKSFPPHDLKPLTNCLAISPPFTP